MRDRGGNGTSAEEEIQGGNEASTEEVSRGKREDCRPPSSYQQFLFPRHQNFRPLLLPHPPHLNFLQNAMFREGTHLKKLAGRANSRPLFETSLCLEDGVSGTRVAGSSTRKRKRERERERERLLFRPSQRYGGSLSLV